MNKTALFETHQKLGAKIVPFAGYEMPVQYEGIMAEHNHTREKAGLFDVSHMGQAWLEGEGALEFLTQITPSSFAKLSPHKAKYTVLLNANGGIVDDLIITKITDTKFFVVYNAGCKEKDEAFIASKIPPSIKFTPLRDRSLIALQGSKAEEILGKIFQNLPQGYMTIAFVGDFFISRLGYTGEDGFEISAPNAKAAELWNKILQNPDAKPVGLGARDSLRLEMGYPLYGHDLNDEITPHEANLTWVMANKPTTAPAKLRVGVEVLDKAIVREGAKIFSLDGAEIGVITSGGFSPTLQKPIAQGYVNSSHSNAGTDIQIELRGRKLPGKIHKLNFIEPRTKK